MTTAARGWPERLASASVRRRYLVVVLACVLTAVAAIPAQDLVRLRIRTNFFALLPADQPSVETLNRVIEKLGGWGDLMVVIDSADPAANARFAEAVRASLRGASWVSHSEFRIDDGFLESRALLLVSRDDLAEIRTRLEARRAYEVSRRDPFFVDLLDEGPPSVDFSDIRSRYRAGTALRPTLATADGRTVVVAVYPKGVSGSVRDTRAHVADLTSRMASVDRSSFPADLRVRLGGTFHDRLEEYDAIVRDLAIGAAVMVALFAGLVVWQFRHVAALPLVLLPCLLPLVWTLAAARGIVAELNLITVFLVNVLVGLGIDFTIHGYARFLEERSAGASTETALAAVNRHTVRACWSAATTTIVAFAVLMPMRFLGFRQFGLIASLGLALAFVSATLVLPSLIAIADGRGWIRLPTGSAPTRGRRRLPARPVIAVAAILGLVGLLGATRVEFEHDFSKLRTRVTPESQALRDTVRTVVAGARDPVVFLARDRDDAAALQAALRARQRDLGDRAPFQTVVSVLDLVPADQPARVAELARIRELVDEMAPLAREVDRPEIERYRPLLTARPISEADLPEPLRRRFFGVPGTSGTLVYVLHQVPLADTRRAADLVDAVRTIAVDGRVWHGASDAVVVDDLLRVMREDSRVAIPLAGLAVFLVLLVDFRSPKRAVVAMIPLTVGLLWLMAIMWGTGMRLNFYNMVVLPSLLGIGVDAGIHYYHRFLESPEEWTPDRAASTETAVITSTVTTMISFGSLAASVHQGLASMGQLAVLGLSCILLTSVIVMPAILQRCGRWAR